MEFFIYYLKFCGTERSRPIFVLVMADKSKSEGTVVITSRDPNTSQAGSGKTKGKASSGRHSSRAGTEKQSYKAGTEKNSYKTNTGKVQSSSTTKTPGSKSVSTVGTASGTGNGNNKTSHTTGKTSTGKQTSGPSTEGSGGFRRSTGTIILGKHRHERGGQGDDWKILAWVAVLGASIAAIFFHHTVLFQIPVTQDVILDYLLFFFLLFMMSRFLTTSAALVVIVSVAAFHCLEEIYYHQMTPPGLQGHHVRYFMIMFIVCFITIRLFGQTKK